MADPFGAKAGFFDRKECYHQRSMNFKKTFLYLLIASVSISAVLGVAVILIGNLGEREGRILLTSLTITCMSLLGVACGANLESGRFHQAIPLAGMAFAVVSAVIWIGIIWAEPTGGEYVVKTGLSATLLASAVSFACLLGLASLDKRFRWAQYTAYLTAAVLVGSLLYIIWLENNPSDLIMRVNGALSILIGAFTVIVPIFHRLSEGDDPLTRIKAEIESLQNRLVELEARKKELTKELSKNS